MPSPDPISSAIGAGIGLIGGIGGLLSAGKANRQLEGLLRRDPQYQVNPLAQQRLAYANTLLNARMPGAAAMDRNIYGAEANQMANIQKNAADGSQALAMGAASQGQTDQAFGNAAQVENQDFQRRYQNQVGAQEGMINEDDKVYQDRLRRLQDEANIRGAQAQNRQGAWNAISGAGGGLMNFGLAGGAKGIFGGGGGAGAGASMGKGSSFGGQVGQYNSDGSPIIW
jgi:hypothetical protein